MSYLVLSFTIVKIKYLHFPGTSHLPLLRLDIVPMSDVHKQLWVSLFHELFIFPSGHIRPEVLPLHFNLGNSSLPQLYFSPVENAQRLDQDFSFRFYLQQAIFQVSFF